MKVLDALVKDVWRIWLWAQEKQMQKIIHPQPSPEVFMKSNISESNQPISTNNVSIESPWLWLLIEEYLFKRTPKILNFL